MQESDSAGTKFEGALINAAIFVIIVGVMTFVLFLLFKYGVSTLQDALTCMLLSCQNKQASIMLGITPMKSVNDHLENVMHNKYRSRRRGLICETLAI